MAELDQVAEIVDTAAVSATAIAQLSLSGHELTLDEAYEVQKRSIARRISRGERLVGVKMGFTSRAKMKQMGLNEVIWGRLTDAMQVADGGAITFAKYVHPRVEPEIAFRLKHPLAGRVSEAEAWAAVDAVAPALEIIDSRYRNFKFNLADVVADNSSSSSFVLGPWHAPDVDIGNLEMVMQFDGQPVQKGVSSAILGHPIRSLMEAARLASAGGVQLMAGSIIMAGGATAAEALRPGVSVRLAVEKLGQVAFSVSG